jgi:hypothetical protein
MAIPYISLTIIDKYFDNYVKSQHKSAHGMYILYGIITCILNLKKDESRLVRYDAYMECSAYASHWDHFHNFIVYVRLQQLAP